MYNWNTDLTKFSSVSAQKAWQIAQLLEYGGEGVRVSRQAVVKQWSQVASMLSPEVRRLWELCLWGKVYSLQTNSDFWNSPSLRLKLPTAST